MRAVVQKVKKASVLVDSKITGQIESGLVVLLAVHKDDTEAAIKKMADKIFGLRIFEDEERKMNKSVFEIAGSILLVSQFTLYGDVKKGNRPSFIESAGPEKAQDFYNKLIDRLKEKHLKVETGIFRAKMELNLINNGPVTIIINI